MFQFPANPLVGQQFAPAVGVTYEWNGTGWVLLGMTTASLYPAGIILPYAGYAPPAAALPFQGWLLCDGAAVSRTTYAVLFAVISNTFGNGDGSTTFNLPDLRGRVIAGVDNMGGTFASRLTAATLGSPGTINAQGGAETVTLTTAQLASHSHGVTDTGHGHGVPDPTHSHSASDLGHQHAVHGAPTIIASGGFSAETNNSAGAIYNTTVGNANIAVSAAATGIGNTTYNATGIAVGAAGGGTAHANVQPTLCLNYLIKT